MDNKYWERLQTLYSEAMARPISERKSYLTKVCDGDDVLLKDVNHLLTSHSGGNKAKKKRTTAIAPARTNTILKQLRPRDIVGPYEIMDQIGVGGMGIVYKALDSRLQRFVALKFLPGLMDSDQASRERFLTEARAVSKVDHPNICVIHDINETPDGQLYMTMQYYEGETLATRLGWGRLPFEEALDIAIQIGDGLAAAHAQDIVHRDVKPANIMLTSEKLVRILDFGVAKIINLNMTNSGMMIGTVAYMAPEQLYGEQVDARADIWALGVILYEMLAGRQLLSSDDRQEVTSTMVKTREDVLLEVTGDIPAGINVVLSKSLEPNRNKRYQTMTEMLDALLGLRRNTDGNQKPRLLSRGATTNPPTTSPWDELFLATITQGLLPWLGPITAKLVQRAATTNPNLDDFSAALSAKLPNEAARKLLRDLIQNQAVLHTTPPVIPAVAPQQDTPVLELSPQQLQQLEACLVAYIGPIAGTIIRRTIAQQHSKEQLRQALVKYLHTEQEKTRFCNELKDIV